MFGIDIINRPVAASSEASGGSVQAVERARIEAILTHPAAAGRSDLAKALAFTTRATVDEAVAQLATAPLQPAEGGSSPHAALWGKAVADINRRSGRMATAGQATSPASSAPRAAPGRNGLSHATLWGEAVAEVNRRNGFGSAAR